MHNVDFMVGGNELGGGALGLLGRNLLGWADTEYDLPHGVVRIMRPNKDCADANMAYWAGSTPVVELPLRDVYSEHAPAIKTRVRINGKSVTAMFDTGAQSILSLSAAKRTGIVDDENHLTPSETVYGAGHGDAASWIVPVDSIELAGERIDNSRLQVADFFLAEADMLIGIDFFLSHRIYVANSQGRMYFTYSGGPVFDLSATTAGAEAQSEREDPQDANAFARRGAIRAARNDLVRALADFNRACELAPAEAAYFAQRGRILARLERHREAVADYNEALRLNGADYATRLERARLHVVTSDFGAAVDDLQVLMQSVPKQADMRLAIGEIFTAAGHPRQAIPQYDLWIAAHDDDYSMPRVLNARCWARALAGIELDLALADCNAALRAKPKEPAYIDSRGLVYLRQGQLAKALKDYDDVLSLNPTLPWSLYARGLVRIGMGERERGNADIQAAVKLLPTIEAEARRIGLVAP